MSGEASMMWSMAAREPRVPDCSASTKPSMVRRAPIEWANISTFLALVCVRMPAICLSLPRATSALLRSYT